MDLHGTRHVVNAETVDDGVIITFDNGLCAIYPATLLYSMFTSAKLVESEPE